MKKIIALAMVVLMIFALVGCGSNKRVIVEVTLSTEDSEAILAAAGISLPDVAEVAAAGSTVQLFSWYDDFHNYSEDEIVNTGFFTFKEKYGCEVEWVETTWAKRFDDLANLILGGTPADFYTMETDIFPTYCIKGMFQPVNDYIDYDDPLWQGTKTVAENYFSLGDNTYIMAIDIGATQVVGYNRRVIDEWGFEDPAQLYYNDEWTWDVFYDMCLEFSDPDEDRFALDGWYYDTALMDSSGTTIVKYNTETGLFESNLDDPRLERSADLVYNLKKNECIFPVWNRGWQLRGGAEVQGTGIKDGLCLFFIVGTWGFTGTVEEISAVWGDVTEGEVMFCPLPRDAAGDGNYYCSVKPTGYCIISGASNPEGVALLAACERFKVLDPTVVSIDEKQLRETYLWTEEMLEMYDICHAAANSEYVSVEYNDGLGIKLADSAGECKRIGRKATAQTWAQLKEKYSEQVIYYIEELNMEIAEYVANLG
ncbi:MAG: extracellular solute-binding protein [Oscillospiraceae bacterium]|nr:extracellular solute-binding protein [Oscillospiraceae bacterium]